MIIKMQLNRIQVRHYSQGIFLYQFRYSSTSFSNFNLILFKCPLFLSRVLAFLQKETFRLVTSMSNFVPLFSSKVNVFIFPMVSAKNTHFNIFYNLSFVIYHVNSSDVKQFKSSCVQSVSTTWEYNYSYAKFKLNDSISVLRHS